MKKHYYNLKEDEESVDIEDVLDWMLPDRHEDDFDDDSDGCGSWMG